MAEVLRIKVQKSPAIAGLFARFKVYTEFPSKSFHNFELFHSYWRKFTRNCETASERDFVFEGGVFVEAGGRRGTGTRGCG
jgi:hypothetical protein